MVLCITAHTLWITWVTADLSDLLSYALNRDDSLASATPLRAWEVTVIKQVEPTDGLMKMQLALPSMPSLYIISFLYQSCLEIRKSEGTYWTELYCINLCGGYYRRLSISTRTIWHLPS